MKRVYLCGLVLLCLQVTAQKLPFQGRLLDNGIPFNGTATFEFSISDPAWSETISDVSVSDGFYSVVLGESTALPKNIFTDGEAALNITVNNTTLSSVNIYANQISDSTYTNHIAAIGVNDEEKTVVSTTNDGYDGYLLLKDSLNRVGGFMLTRKTGGYIQLNQRDLETDALKAAVVTGTFGDQNSFFDLYGGNSSNDGLRNMVNMYASNLDENGNTRSDGYRRGGIDLYNYDGDITSFYTSEPDGGIFGLHNTNSGDVTVFLDGATGQIDGTSANIENVNATTVNQSSDGRLKKDIRSLEHSLSKVKRLRGVSYTWKDSNKPQGKQIGVIAQELEEIYPEFVTTRENGFKAVNYSQMTAILIEAVKELNEKVEVLEKEKENLEGRLASIDQIQSDLELLKSMLGQSKASSK